MDEAIRKASVLLEALGWIRRFRGRYVVVKLGGSSLDNSDAVNGLLTDLIFMESVGMKPVLVHGGGKSISQAMASAGIEPKFVQGRRYTDDETLEIATRVLAEEICPSLVDAIRRMGGEAAGLSFATQNVLIGEELTLTGDNGEPVDLGAVGRVTDVDSRLIETICRSEKIPVIPSVALTREGKKLNVNADTAAAAVAGLLRAEKLVFLSDVPGIYRDHAKSESRISHLDAESCRDLVADGTIQAGMVPKVEAALEALTEGVRKVHIVDAGMPHSVLLEIYSDTGVGTEIVC